MKRTALLATLLICIISLHAQKIKYVSSFEKAKKKALELNRPIAILITINPPVHTPAFENGLKDPAVVEKFNNNFVNYKVEMEDTADSRKLIREYKVYKYPSYLFLDSKGGVLFTDVAFLSWAGSLLKLADKAIAASLDMSLVDYDAAYNAGDRTTAFLKRYINKRMSTGLSDNANLIEEYINDLTMGDLKNYEEVLFILKAGPLVDSNAYKVSHENWYLIDSIFKTEPLSVRVAMNNATINNTMASAIAKKNIDRAFAAADFTRKSWSNDREQGQKSWHSKLLQYYKAVRDTSNYLNEAAQFYDKYYMNITSDSARRKDSMDYITAKNKAKEYATTSTVNGVTRQSFSFMTTKNTYATDLNNAAWAFYQMAGDNTYYLMKAIAWSKRSIDLNPIAGFYDTYAHLLYRLKHYDEAESMQSKAIDMAEEENADVKMYKEDYKKMKKKTL